MANKKHVEILKNGVDYWNKWRKEIPFHTLIDLTGIDLEGYDLRGRNFRGVDLSNASLKAAALTEVDFAGAKLNGANLIKADLRNAYLGGAHLKGVDISGALIQGANFDEADLREAQIFDANLDSADLSYANLDSAILADSIIFDASFVSSNLHKADLTNVKLNRADLSNAGLNSANLKGAILKDAILQKASLIEANLSGAILDGVNFSEADVGRTIFDFVDLSNVNGLETVRHYGPSNIGTSTLSASRGNIPIEFLRGCGMSDWEIETINFYKPGLSNQDLSEILYRIHDIRASKAIQISPLFISYSHEDSEFVDELEKYLTNDGIRFWRDIHHAVAGRIEKQIDVAIRHNPTVILILSKSSVKSDWVQHEVRLARKLEIDLGRDVLCPVALDKSWISCNWPERIKEQVMEYLVLDFSQWYDERDFKQKYKKLIDGLSLFY